MSQNKSKGNNKDKKREEYNTRDQRQPKDVTKNTRKNAECVDPKVANDVKWYSKSPQLLKDSASLSFGRALGSEITFNPTVNEYDDSSLSLIHDNYAINSENNAKEVIPGIMKIELIPGYGVSTDNVSALNLAVRNIYSYVRHANSGHSNYDAPDLGLYLMAMDNVYTAWGWMVRLYGLAASYNGMNRYYPESVIRSMGVDFDDLIANLPQFRAYINLCANKMNSLYVPAVMPVFVRHQWLYTNIYLDSPGNKAQTYYFNPKGFLFYNEYDGAGKLEFRPLSLYMTNGSNLTVEDIKLMFNGMINLLLESEDIGIMSGDILKAYTLGKCFMNSQIPETYSVLPAYSEEVNMQIHNLRNMALPESYNTHSFDVTQSETSGALLYLPRFASSAPGYDTSYILDMYTTESSPEHTMVSTRLGFSAKCEQANSVSLPDGSGGTLSTPNFIYNITTCGTELVANIKVYTIDPDFVEPSENDRYATEVLVRENDSAFGMGQGNFSNITNALRSIADLATFDWAPLVRVWSLKQIAAEGGGAGSSELICVGYVNDIDNYTVIDGKDLASMNDVALLSLLDVPASV